MANQLKAQIDAKGKGKASPSSLSLSWHALFLSLDIRALCSHAFALWDLDQQLPVSLGFQLSTETHTINSICS